MGEWPLTADPVSGRKSLSSLISTVICRQNSQARPALRPTTHTTTSKCVHLIPTDSQLYVKVVPSIFTAFQVSCWKVMFSLLFVCLFTGVPCDQPVPVMH